MIRRILLLGLGRNKGFAFFVLLLLTIAAYGQQERVAVINTVDDRDSVGISELAYLTDKLRETAVNVLPKPRYGVMTTESIVAFLGSHERMVKECKAASCLAELGRKVSADYVTQARIGRFGENLTIKAELYSSKSGNLLSSFTGYSKDILGLLAIVDEKASVLFKQLPGVSGISGVSSSSDASVEIGESKKNKFFTDSRDGQKYKMVEIGRQTWMAENLNYNVSGSKCYYYNPSYCNKYGRLYDWNMARRVCPKGWHLPTNAEWDILTARVGGSLTAGKYLKAVNGWNNYKKRSGNGTDDYGFTALPGGGLSNGNFDEVGGYGGWWSASRNNADLAYFLVISYNGDGTSWGNDKKNNLISVRCIQD